MTYNKETNALSNISVYIDRSITPDKAESLAEHINIDATELEPEENHSNLILRYTEEGLSLEADGMSLVADFSHMKSRLRKNNLQSEQLIKVAKIKGADTSLTIIDATAGFGEDSLILAAAGYTVHLYEYNPVIAALLRDCLERAKKTPELCEIVERMILHEENSIDAMKSGKVSADIVLLDPMFPARQKSGLIKKKFQLLQKLEQPCCDENELFDAAVGVNPKKIIIKRPLKGPFLAGHKPDYSNEGKAIRYDCIYINKN